MSVSEGSRGHPSRILGNTLGNALGTALGILLGIGREGALGAGREHALW